MKKKPFRVQIDPEHEASLHRLGAPYNLTGNAVLAAAASELTKVEQAGGNLWHALGRIAPDDTAQAIPAPAATRIARSGRTLHAVT